MVVVLPREPEDAICEIYWADMQGKTEGGEAQEKMADIGVAEDWAV